MSEPNTPPSGRPGMSPDLPTPAEALTIRPGQTLVLRYDQPVTAADAERVKGKLAERIPGVSVVIIGGCQQMAGYDPTHEGCGGKLMPGESGTVCNRCGLMEP